MRSWSKRVIRSFRQRGLAVPLKNCHQTTMKVTILANGDNKRLLGVANKVLFPVNGTPLIRRTLKQLDGLGVHSIKVVTSKKMVLEAIPGFAQAVNGVGGFMYDYLIALDGMDEYGLNAVVYGDVVWTDEALYKLLNFKRYVDVGRVSEAEGFGQVYDGRHKGMYLKHWERAMDYVSTHPELRDEGRFGAGGWQVYRSIAGLPLDHKRFVVEPSTFHDFGDDPTMDLDKPEDLARLETLTKEGKL